ncbi:MAG: class I SAM-dependent methyltransferase [Acidobacteriota bacterium]
MSLLIRFAESDFAPDSLIRFGIRSLIRQRIHNERQKNIKDPQLQSRTFTEFLRHSPIAVDTKAANEQHYEVPTDFFRMTLGKRLKYSCCYYPSGNETLDQAEGHMLRLTCERAGIEDGLDLLELGCGWGSLTLWMAEHYPRARITAVSNSAPQRKFILERCRKQGWNNVDVITADMNEFQTEQRFDRIRKYAYMFETEGSDNWMGRYFFTGGIMPSYNLLLDFQKKVAIEDRWLLPGYHYQKTAEQWLGNMDRNRERIIPVLAETYGSSNAALWFRRWRIFFMACAELWGYQNGEEWMVAHYVFRKKTC